MERPYLLLTPGPLSTSERVRKAMMTDWCTWDKDYNENIVQALRAELLKIAKIESNNYNTVLLQGSGTYSVEAAITSVVGKSGKVLVFANGAYGDRIGEICSYGNITSTVVYLDETEQITAAMVAEELVKDSAISHVAVVHCETTTGILNPIEEIADVVKSAGKIFIVDAMSSFGGIPIDVEELGIDVIISSANKCIQGVPGFGFIILRNEVLAACKGNATTLSLDVYEQAKCMDEGGGKWRFTSPTHVVRAFFEAMQELREEGGVEARYARYKKNHDTLVAGMERAGFKALLEPSLQGPIITSFLYPNENFSFNDFYYKLKERGFVIYPGKISKAPTFRIGNIGDVHPADFEKLTQIISELEY